MVIDPLVELVKGRVGASKDQVKSASFCLRRLVEHLNTKITDDLVAKLFETLTSGRITAADYIHMITTIIRKTDITPFATKPLFRHSIYAISCGTNKGNMGHIPGE